MSKDKQEHYEEKADELARIEGFESGFDLLDAVGFDSVQPGICVTEGCDYSTQVEPDQDKGYCEECEAGTVASISILMGVI